MILPTTLPQAIVRHKHRRWLKSISMLLQHRQTDRQTDTLLLSSSFTSLGTGHWKAYTHTHTHTHTHSLTRSKYHSANLKPCEYLHKLHINYINITMITGHTLSTGGIFSVQVNTANMLPHIGISCYRNTNTVM